MAAGSMPRPEHQLRQVHFVVSATKFFQAEADRTIQLSINKDDPRAKGSGVMGKVFKSVGAAAGMSAGLAAAAATGGISMKVI